MINQLSEGMIKGRIAEAIVEEMFLAMGYEVYRYGVESLVPNFLNRLSVYVFTHAYFHSSGEFSMY